MQKFVGKTSEDALDKAALELKTEKENICVVNTKETKGLFGKIKSVEITCYTESMVVDFVVDYLKTMIEKMGLEVELTPILDDGVIRVNISTNHNSIIIGKNGKTLQAFNEICRCAASAEFSKRVRVLLDVENYKEEKYTRLAALARREAIKVSKSHVTVELSPMTADERKVVHSVLSNFRHIKTQSVGEGKDRHITIIYEG